MHHVDRKRKIECGCTYYAKLALFVTQKNPGGEILILQDMSDVRNTVLSLCTSVAVDKKLNPEKKTESRGEMDMEVCDFGSPKSISQKRRLRKSATQSWASASVSRPWPRRECLCGRWIDPFPFDVSSISQRFSPVLKTAKSF